MALFNLSQLVTIDNKDDFGMVVNTIPIYSGDEFYSVVCSRYSHMLFETPASTIDTAKTDLKNIYDMWARMNGEDFLRIYNAMRVEYSPIENYDRLEEGETETARHKGSRTAQAVNMTSTPNTTNTTVEKLNAYDGGEVDSAKTTTTNTGTTTTSGASDANYTETRDISDTVYDKDIETFRGRRTHGNAGVTTTQSLITEEIRLRLSGFVETIISQFIEKYTFYVSGV